MSWILGLGLPLIGAWLLFFVGKRVNSFLHYQLITLFLAIPLATIAYVFSDSKSILKIGNLSATPHNIIGASYGAFTLIAFGITTLVVYLQVAKGRSVNRAILLKSLVWAIPLSAFNALTEELIFRATVVQALQGTTTAITVAIISGLLFGIPHYFGTPGKIPGVLMAGFLGLIAAQSIFDTGGIGWAWAMHFVQDVPIITMLLFTGLKKI